MPLNKDQWRTLVRRALDIPDVIGVDVAVEIAADVAYQSPVAATETRGRDIEFEERVGLAILEETAKAGKRGDLDRFIMGRENRGNGSSKVSDVDYIVTTKARESGNAPSLPQGMAVPILEKVKEYVLANPFDLDRTHRQY